VESDGRPGEVRRQAQRGAGRILFCGAGSVMGSRLRPSVPDAPVSASPEDGSDEEG